MFQFFQYHQKREDDLHIKIWYWSLQRYSSLYSHALHCSHVSFSVQCTAGLQNSSLPQDSTGSLCWPGTLQPLISITVCHHRQYSLQLQELAQFAPSKMILFLLKCISFTTTITQLSLPLHYLSLHWPFCTLFLNFIFTFRSSIQLFNYSSSSPPGNLASNMAK